MMNLSSEILVTDIFLQVNDTGLIQEEAEIYAAESRVEVIHHLEATIACLHRGDNIGSVTMTILAQDPGDSSVAG